MNILLSLKLLLYLKKGKFFFSLFQTFEGPCRICFDFLSKIEKLALYAQDWRKEFWTGGAKFFKKG